MGDAAAAAADTVITFRTPHPVGEYDPIVHPADYADFMIPLSRLKKCPGNMLLKLVEAEEEAGRPFTLLCLPAACDPRCFAIAAHFFRKGDLISSPDLPADCTPAWLDERVVRYFQLPPLTSSLGTLRAEINCMGGWRLRAEQEAHYIADEANRVLPYAASSKYKGVAVFMIGWLVERDVDQWGVEEHAPKVGPLFALNAPGPLASVSAFLRRPKHGAAPPAPGAPADKPSSLGKPEEPDVVPHAGVHILSDGDLPDSLICKGGGRHGKDAVASLFMLTW